MQVEVEVGGPAGGAAAWTACCCARLGMGMVLALLREHTFACLFRAVAAVRALRAWHGPWFGAHLHALGS